MRTMAKAVLVLVMALMTLSCAEAPTAPEADGLDAALVVKTKKKKGHGNVGVPFKARFFTDLQGIVPDGCAPGVGHNTQAGEGNATHLGKFSTVMSFCVVQTPGPDFLKYAFQPGEDGRFVAANGDELWFTIEEGQVILITEPGPHGAFFKDRFEFTGGTGRFEGASGEGWTDSLVDAAFFRTEHVWTGTLVLPRGKGASTVDPLVSEMRRGLEANGEDAGIYRDVLLLLEPNGDAAADATLLPDARRIP